MFFGGLSIKKDEEVLKKNCPHIVVGTPGRILALARNKSLNLKHIKHFILDECDKMLEQLGEWQCWAWASEHVPLVGAGAVVQGGPSPATLTRALFPRLVLTRCGAQEEGPSSVTCWQ